MPTKAEKMELTLNDLPKLTEKYLELTCRFNEKDEARKILVSELDKLDGELRGLRNEFVYLLGLHTDD
jgi:hypothetical protein